MLRIKGGLLPHSYLVMVATESGNISKIKADQGKSGKMQEANEFQGKYFYKSNLFSQEFKREIPHTLMWSVFLD